MKTDKYVEYGMKPGSYINVCERLFKESAKDIKNEKWTQENKIENGQCKNILHQENGTN